MNRISVVIPARESEVPKAVALARSLAPYVNEVVVQNGPGGPAVARNIGARKVAGEIVVFVDADVTLPFPEQLGCLRQPDPGIVLWVPERLRNRTRHPYTELCTRLINAYNHFQTRSPDAVGTFMAVRADAFRRVNGFDPHTHFEDTDLGWRITDLGDWAVAPVEVWMHRRWKWESPWHASSHNHERQPESWPSAFEIGTR